MNNLVIGGTIFEHRDIHKLTWNSPNMKDKNQIDHIIINGHWKHSLIDHLIVAKVKLKLKAQKETRNGERKVNIDQLQKKRS